MSKIYNVGDRVRISGIKVGYIEMQLSDTTYLVRTYDFNTYTVAEKDLSLYDPDDFDPDVEAAKAYVGTVVRATRGIPDDYASRKQLPIATGVLDYFPDALAEVSRASLSGNKQHMPGEPLHWDRSKSTDQADALIRHFMQRGTVDTDGVLHSAKVAWRALALLQLEIENDKKTP